jgi:hypothetical protein
MKMKKKLIEGEHFYYNEHGFMVLTAKYHLENGECCGNGCLNCPFGYVNVPEHRYRELTEAGILKNDEKKDLGE